jgi:hypothetical protein
MRRICSLINIPRPTVIANIRNALKLVALDKMKGTGGETERTVENNIEVDIQRKVL